MQTLRVLFSLVIVGVIVGGPVAYVQYRRAHIRNFHVVRDGVLYRSGQLSLAGLKAAVHEYGIKTVLTLRFPKEPGMPPPDLEEEEFCKLAQINHYRITARKWTASVGPIPAQKNVDTFLSIMRNPANHPVLIHCFAGMHRAGTYCAVFRMEMDGWSSADAIREMKHFGYTREDFDVLDYLEHYARQGTPGTMEDAETPPGEAAPRPIDQTR